MDENIANRILDKDLENIVKKVAQGKILTSVERARIENAYKKEEPAKVPAYALNYVELAEILGITRQTINRWRKLKMLQSRYQTASTTFQSGEILSRRTD